MQLPAPTRETDRTLIENVQRHGWQVVGVTAEDGSTGWAFSVGLYYTFGHPEVVLFGRTTEAMHAALDTVGRDVKAGHRFEDRSECEGLLEGGRCAFRTVRPRWFEPFLGYALWLYGATPFPALQCLWADDRGRYPWEPTFRADWSELQPLLFRDDVGAAGVTPWLRTLGDGGP